MEIEIADGVAQTGQSAQLHQAANHRSSANQTVCATVVNPLVLSQTTSAGGATSRSFIAKHLSLRRPAEAMTVVFLFGVWMRSIMSNDPRHRSARRMYSSARLYATDRRILCQIF